ncbi:unnamed protein product, partial [Hapterophycus canaliculatus]
MPSSVRVRVVEARDLPEMDRTVRGEFCTDAYVDIKFRNYEQRTAVCKKTLNPYWGEEFKFEVADDSVLQNEPIEFKVMDHDVYTTNDAIGLVYVDLSPLFMRTAEREQDSQRDLVVQGWFPLYDTLRGVRGALCLVIKVRFIGDQNPFRESSAGVQFFGVSTLNPELYIVQKGEKAFFFLLFFLPLFAFVGLVDELVVDNDPEYQWMDNFRQARTSNESRQSLLYKLDATVRRQLGKKVLDLGCNAVLAYQQDFDVEGDSGIVARAYGTACVIQRREQQQQQQQ